MAVEANADPTRSRVFRYPRLDVYFRPGDDGGRMPDRVERVEINGVPWPVKAVAWEAEHGDRTGNVTIKIRGQVRFHEIEEEATDDGKSQD